MKVEDMTIKELNEFMLDHGFCNTDNKEDLPKKYVCDLVESALKEGRNKAIYEFAERLKEKILEEIDDVSESQRNYEVGSDMSLTCSHIMGTLRDVYHRVIDEIAEEMKEGGV